MKEISLIKHTKGALGLRLFGLGPNLKPTNGLIKLQKLLDTNAFWAKNRTINDLKKCLANSDVVISLWVGKEIVCLLYTSPSPRDSDTSRMPSSA